MRSNRPVRPFTDVVANPVAWMWWMMRLVGWLLYLTGVLTVVAVRATWRLVVRAQREMNAYYEEKNRPAPSYGLLQSQPDLDQVDGHYRRAYDALPARIQHDFPTPGRWANGGVVDTWRPLPGVSWDEVEWGGKVRHRTYR